MKVEDLLIANRGGLRFGKLGRRWVHICVDMQVMFLRDTPWQAKWIPRVMPMVVRLVEAAPERTVFTRFLPPRTLADAGGTWRRYYERWPMMTRDRLGEQPLALVPELARLAASGRVHDKAVYSPWYDGRLHAELQGLGVDTVIVTGTETEVCVLATVLGAVDHGYRVIVATDAVCSSADSTHDAMQEIYHSRYGMQVETAGVAELLEAM